MTAIDACQRGLFCRMKCVSVLVVFLLWIHEAAAAASSSTPLDAVKLGNAATSSTATETGNKQRRRRVKRSDYSSSSILPKTTNTTSSVEAIKLEGDTTTSSPAAGKKRKRRRVKQSDSSTRTLQTSSSSSVEGERYSKRKKRRQRATKRNETGTSRVEQKQRNTTKGMQQPLSETMISNASKPAFVLRGDIGSVANITKVVGNNSSSISLASSTRNQTKPVATQQTDRLAANRTSTKKKAPTKSKKRASAAAIGGREAACLRRIKREWRDAVKLGIAYDWMRMETVKRSDSSSTSKHDYVRIGPWGKNLLRWHFSVQGPANSVYKDGVYHGRVLLPKDYPGSPPRVHLLTPSGRFIPGYDICLSASHYHPESWTPRWTVLSLVDALRLHMLTTANEIGGMNASNEKREKLALASRKWNEVVNHEYMVKAGIFPMHSDQCVVSDGVSSENDKAASDTVEKQNDYSGSNKAMSTLKESGLEGQQAVRRTREEVIEKRHSQHGPLVTAILHAVVEVLTSPTKLVILAFLTVFVLLNLH